ncbi:uncharacterized protein LOC134540286 [Bacillus rossius redtenbacheri]|uniref:uncharacterized protein LOC134540286 n=1 Tax=Bacillus rossius redtenbacheri TaxID=93214 RepID=UPI002FDD8C9B
MRPSSWLLLVALSASGDLLRASHDHDGDDDDVGGFEPEGGFGIRHGRSKSREAGSEDALSAAPDDVRNPRRSRGRPGSSGFVDQDEQEEVLGDPGDPPSTETSEDQEEEAGGGGDGAGVDVVTRFLRIVESQHLLGDNCTAGTDLHLGEGVVDRYAQERFRLEAEVAVNRANWLTRLWKYAEPRVLASEYLLHASLFSVVEFDDDIFAAGNCYDQGQYKGHGLFCPYAHRLPEGPILAKDLAVEYKYLGNSSEWFFIARRNAENVIRNHSQFSRGYHTYTHNDSAHTERVADEILSVRYEDGKWSKPYYDCGGGNIWMLTYTVPFFGFRDGQYFFKGTSGIDIDLRRVDIDQCPLPSDSTQLNIFAASDKCKKKTTECVPLPGLGFRRGSYKCVCRRGFYFPSLHASKRYYNGSVIEEEYEKLMLGEDSLYSAAGAYECLQCAEGCESCENASPCVASLNWVMRTALLVLCCVVIGCLPIVAFFTWKYGGVKVVRAASPVLLRVIVLGAFFIYCTTIVMYPRPNIYTCTLRVWFREVGFSLTYGALMLKTWRISVIFRVRSAKAVRITDADLLKRLGAVVGVCGVLLLVRTLVAPPRVVVGRTADDLKAYLCRTDWWDHAFTTLEVMFLVWGIRLCIVVRKAPSEFNESRFISMAIYNEFLLSVFLNVSMLFLQSPANPDLLFIIFFCHTQLTATLLLCLIFGSKAYMVLKCMAYMVLKCMAYMALKGTAYMVLKNTAYMVLKGTAYMALKGTANMVLKGTANMVLKGTAYMVLKGTAYMVLKGQGKQEPCVSASKPQAAKFLARPKGANSQGAPSTNSSTAGLDCRLADGDVQEEFLQLCAQLEALQDKAARSGCPALLARLSAVREALGSPPPGASPQASPPRAADPGSTEEATV